MDSTSCQGQGGGTQERCLSPPSLCLRSVLSPSPRAGPSCLFPGVAQQSPSFWALLLPHFLPSLPHFSLPSIFISSLLLPSIPAPPRRFQPCLAPWALASPSMPGRLFHHPPWLLGLRGCVSAWATFTEACGTDSHCLVAAAAGTGCLASAPPPGEGVQSWTGTQVGLGRGQEACTAPMDPGSWGL